MKLTIISASIVLSLLLFIGCAGDSNSVPETSGTQLNSETASNAVDQAAGELKAELGKFIQSGKEQLSDADGIIAKAEAKLSSAPAPVAAALKEPLEKLKTAHVNATEKLNALRETDPQQAGQAKEQLEKALSGLSESVDQIKNLL